MVDSRRVGINSRAHLEVIDITAMIEKEVQASPVRNGLVNIFCPGSTGAITTLEFEPGLQKDLPAFLERLVPYAAPYAHHATWGDDNGSGHIQSALLKTSFTVPLIEGRLTLGTWQQIVFVECDTRGRHRELIVQILGE